ncbi:MAG: hypothetical protein FWE80_01955 [Oscillospiraceae bacterium]|nr:hypothetical protein [Oscillospiraceae bacterium]
MKATSTDGAGIGGGFGRDSGGSGGTITITGSTVTATSSQGAGIGGGYSVTPSSGGSGGTITIADNAVVTATSSRAGAGIGAGGSGGISVPSPLSGADLTIDSTATVKAYSRFSTWPAIHAATVSGDGFFVNNYINANATYNRDIKV